MTTYRVIWGRPFPAWADFRYQPAADHYADIKRQLGARDVGVVALPETPATSPETGLGATNTPYCDGRASEKTREAHRAPCDLGGNA